MDEQPQEHQDMDQSHVDVTMPAMTPAAAEDIKTPAAAQLLAEPTTDPPVQVTGEAGGDMVSAMSVEHEEEATTVDVSPAAEEEQHRTPTRTLTKAMWMWQCQQWGL